MVTKSPLIYKFEVNLQFTAGTFKSTECAVVLCY